MALDLLGGTTAAAAKEVGVTAQAVAQWPAVLPRRIEDRVLAALARKHLPPELMGQPHQDASPPPVDAASTSVAEGA